MSGPKHQRPKGTLDYVPPDSGRRRTVEDVFRYLAGRHGYQEVITPVFEHTDVFVKSSGAGSDIVTKEMYSFDDRSDRSLTLRPEGTPGVVRAVLENRVKLPCRLFYVGPYFRYGRPQKGRYREFGQLGVEAIGEASPWVDAEIISLGDEFFRLLGITDCTTKLNTIGCSACRPGYRKQLVGFLTGRRAELCDDCQVRLERNPLRVFDCKNETCRLVVADAPKPRQHLCSDCAKHFEEVQRALARQSVIVQFDDGLVRGLDYYSRTTFEYISGQLGAQDSLGGGGRYDYLVEEFGGPATAASGLAIGIDRTLLAMPPAGAAPRRPLAFVVWLTKNEFIEAVEVLDRLRAQGVPAQMDYDARNAKRQFKSADAAGAACAVIVGPDELARGGYSIKDLTTGEQLFSPAHEIAVQVRAVFPR